MQALTRRFEGLSGFDRDSARARVMQFILMQVRLGLLSDSFENAIDIRRADTRAALIEQLLTPPRAS
jgi:hypothetical protein